MASMRRSIGLALLALSLTVPRGAAGQTMDLRAEIEQLNREMEDAVNRGDPIGAASYYAGNAVMRTANRVMATGREQIDRFFAGLGSAKWKLDVIQVGGHPDAPYQIGKSTLIHGVRPDTSRVDFVLYWRRQADGRLRIELDYYH